MAQTETKLVAFVDILGFSKLIAAYVAGKNDRLFELLKQAINPATTFMRESFELAKGGPFFAWKDCQDVGLFLDCLCAAAPLNFKNYSFIEHFFSN
jgi:hypothetical protein